MENFSVVIVGGLGFRVRGLDTGFEQTNRG